MAIAALPPNKHQEKSLRTRGLLLDAAIDSLAEGGYANASIADIAARAGVTRGAQVHHFRTRTELFAQVIEHLTQRQREAMARCRDSLPASARPAEIVVQLVAATFASKLGKASIVLYVSLANDADLRRDMLRVQRDLTADLLQTCAQLVGAEVPRDRLESTFWLTINVVRGTILDEMLGVNDRRRKQAITHWTHLASVSLASQ